MDTTTGDFSLLMKNTNKMELNERLMEKMKLSKIGYSLSKDYLMTKRENLSRAIKELKSWHLI